MICMIFYIKNDRAPITLVTNDELNHRKWTSF